MSKQTAVEWLINYIGKEEGAFTKGYILRLLEQAKEMEKQQILFAYNDGAMGAFEKSYKGMHEYYNETYGDK
jgi:hypothetical protein